MNDRFDSGGSFSGTFARPTASSATNPANQPPVAATAPVAGLGNPLAAEGDSPSGKKGAKTPPKATTVKVEFEGNRFGISPVVVGLIIGIALIAYNIVIAAKDSSWSSSSDKGEVREYKRQIRPMDLPGR